MRREGREKTALEGAILRMVQKRGGHIGTSVDSISRSNASNRSCSAPRSPFMTRGCACTPLMSANTPASCVRGGMRSVQI